MTNADRIRSMTDEEISKFISAVRCCILYGDDCDFPICPSMKGNYCYGIKNDCDDRFLKWLQKEVDE